MKKKILFIDDDEFIIKIFLDRLQAAGFEIDTAKNGKQAREKLTYNQYDVICLDYVLPDETGLDILKWIRGKNKELPVIIFSASGHEPKMKEFMEAGATQYLQKDHVAPGEFVERINTLLGATNV